MPDIIDLDPPTEAKIGVVFQDLEGHLGNVILVTPQYSYLFNPLVFRGMIEYYALKIIKTEAPVELFSEEGNVDEGRGSTPGD